MKFILKSVFILVLLAPISGFSQSQESRPLSLRERVNRILDSTVAGEDFTGTESPNTITPQENIASVVSAFKDVFFSEGEDGRLLLKLDRESIFRIIAANLVWIESLACLNFSGVLEALRTNWGILETDPDLNYYMVQYIYLSLEAAPLSPTALAAGVSSENILELFYLEAEEAVKEARAQTAGVAFVEGRFTTYASRSRYEDMIMAKVAAKASSQREVPLIAELQRRGIGQAPTPADYKASVEAVQAAGDAVLAAQAEGSLIAYQLDADMLDGVSEIVAAKLMEGHGVRRAISAKDADVVRQKIHEVLQLEFQQKGIVIEPEVVTAAIQAVPELTLTWGNARALVRGICETGLKRGGR